MGRPSASVKLDVSQPKKVGRAFRPKATKVSWSGMDGKAVWFCRLLLVERS